MGKFTRSFYTRPELWKQIEEMASAQGVAISAVVNRAIHEYLQRDFTKSSWDTMPEDDWYDERRFYTYSQDKKGHSVTARFAIPKNVAGGIKRLVDSGAIPEIRSVADFYRNAIFHWTRKVATWVDDGELVSEMSWHQLQLEDDTIKQTRLDFENLLDGMRANMEEFLREKDLAYMETYLSQRENAATYVPQKYRDDYMNVLRHYREKLGLVKGGQVAFLD
jgi:hypothetical protein